MTKTNRTSLITVMYDQHSIYKNNNIKACAENPQVSVLC